MATCSQCQRELPEVSESGRCPHCGHAYATVHLGAVGVMDAVVTEIGYGVDKSWLEQWGQVERSYKKLQELYSASVVDNQEAQTIVKDFFTHCWHLKDWLDKDTTISVRGKDVWSLHDAELDLQICRAMANTSKHHTLKDKAEMSARVGTVILQPHGKATIEVTDPATSTYARDALELADSCMKMWCKFIAARGLKI